MHDESVPLLWGGFTITAAIDADTATADGVICALGDWFGGYALYLIAGVVRFSFARAADLLELATAAPVAVGRHEVVITYRLGEGAAPGRMVLHLDGEQADEISVDGMLPMALQHGGAGLRVGYDSGFPVSPAYTPPSPFTGTIDFVRIETPAAALLDGAQEVRAALHSD